MSNPCPSNVSLEEEENDTFNLNDLPAELQLQVLFRCPVKELLRFKWASKSSYALTSDPSFIKSHMKFHVARNKILICTSWFEETGRKQIDLVSFNLPPISVFTISRNLMNIYNEPSDFNNVSFSNFSKNIVLTGSINRIVCVTNCREMEGRFIGVWNPSISY